MDYISVTETEHYATDVQHLEQLCDYIINEIHVNTVLCEMNRRLQTDGIIDMPAILVVCRETIKRKYPLIQASVYEFDVAVNEMSNLITELEHQQDMPLRDLFRTIYESYNEFIRIGGWMVDWGMFRVWREQNEEMYGQLKMICRKLKKEPRGIIDGVGDIVYI
jgi:hypothetical protein